MPSENRSDVHEDVLGCRNSQVSLARMFQASGLPAFSDGVRGRTCKCTRSFPKREASVPRLFNVLDELMSRTLFRLRLSGMVECVVGSRGRISRESMLGELTRPKFRAGREG